LEDALLKNGMTPLAPVKIDCEEEGNPTWDFLGLWL
jgi:hypothetical protein